MGSEHAEHHLQAPESSTFPIATRLEGVGIGLRHRHFVPILEEEPDIPWLEVHPENFFSPGSSDALFLEKIRALYPLSAHGVGLSLGSAEPPSEEHLANLQAFIQRFEPTLVSEHVSWNALSGVHLPDLLPLPYTEEAAKQLVENIDRVQSFLNRQILIENPSSYVGFVENEMSEPAFLNQVVQQSGCGLLLDINNIHVTAHNHGLDEKAYLSEIKAEAVQEMHLAGYTIDHVGEAEIEIYVDTHGREVQPAVWALYEKALALFPHTPTLIEWDTDVPELSVLLGEKAKAEEIARKVRN